MRYFKIWHTFLKMSLMADMEYRLNILLRVLGDVVWYAAQLAVFEVLFRYTDHIGSWDVHSMRVFMGTLFVIDGIYMILFQENLDMFSSMIRRGDLDLNLTKPMNSQFMVSCKKVSTAFIVNVIGVSIYLVWALNQLSVSITPWQILAFGLAGSCGVITLYSLRFMFCCMAVIFQNASNIGFIFFQFYRIGMRPDPFYPVWLRFVILSIVPVAFIASVPARIFVEGIQPWFLLASVAVAALLLKASNMFWNFSLKLHSSASS